METCAIGQLRVFLTDLRSAIGVKAPRDTPLEEAFNRAFAKLPGEEIALGDIQPARLPACEHLESC